MPRFSEITLLLAQAEKQAAEPAAEGGFLQTLMSSPLFIPMILILPVMYFMLFLPEKKKRKEAQQMLDNLKKNDRVVTIGGIVGTVVNATQGSDEVTVRIDENSNTRIHVLRSAISRVLNDGDASDKKDA